MRLCRAARSRTVQPMPLPSNIRKDSASAATAKPVLFRRANLRTRYPADGGQAATASSFK
jgi:hypothetical protein